MEGVRQAGNEEEERMWCRYVSRPPAPVGAMQIALGPSLGTKFYGHMTAIPAQQAMASGSQEDGLGGLRRDHDVRQLVVIKRQPAPKRLMLVVRLFI